MASIREYLTRFGNLTLEMNPFNPVDGLIFAQLSYMNFDGVVGEDPVPLQPACAKMLQKKDFSSMYHFMQADDAKLLVFLGMRKRFAGVELLRYVNILSKSSFPPLPPISPPSGWWPSGVRTPLWPAGRKTSTWPLPAPSPPS